ncbi:putative toxin-antitoxin system toxin component, PIN family [Pedobacter endophyticus]|uniref:Putative toxin-antitoxin system toxin component, PIN family n=1 Tax=Pedobacter endophyticus TaxID=2789740 RepID=A0A7S9L352_9SPHI|nr:putative toxin-antitoxin system toxin component, PIN family [Pedobacter endophyticus]QPH41622.1 putative toxin-antitoxin system toxin component, PIN family [Pedobacter endophyticus]
MKRIKVFVIDTNTLISAFLLPHSTRRKAIDKAISHGVVAVSNDTINEFSDTFIRSKFDKYISLELRLEIIEEFKFIAKLVKPNILVSACRDPRDNKFLELAISANAKYIIAGDDDLLVLNPFENISIVTASVFLNIDL